MSLQQDILSRLTKIHWTGGNWLVMSWSNQSDKQIKNGDSPPEALAAVMKGFPLLENHDICQANFQLLKDDAKKTPSIKQTISAEMRANLVAWSYPEYRDTQTETYETVAETYDLWFYWLTAYLNPDTRFAIGPFHNGEEAVTWARENYQGISFGDVFPYADVPVEYIGASPAPYGWQTDETLSTIHTTVTKYTIYHWKEAGVFFINLSAIQAAMANKESPAYRFQKEDREKIKFSISFPGTLDWKDSYHWSLRLEIFSGKAVDFPVDGENKPQWDDYYLLDRTTFQALYGAESIQEPAQIDFVLDLKNKTITGTVKDDTGAEKVE